MLTLLYRHINHQFCDWSCQGGGRSQSWLRGTSSNIPDYKARLNPVTLHKALKLQPSLLWRETSEGKPQRRSDVLHSQDRLVLRQSHRGRQAVMGQSHKPMGKEKLLQFFFPTSSLPWKPLLQCPSRTFTDISAEGRGGWPKSVPRAVTLESSQNKVLQIQLQHLTKGLLLDRNPSHPLICELKRDSETQGSCQGTRDGVRATALAQKL